MTNQHILRKHLQYCTRLPSLQTTKLLHARVITAGSCLRQPLFFYNNVMMLYASLGDLPTVGEVFDRMTRKGVVSYNIMIQSYARCGNTSASWRLFSQMRMYGIFPTHFTLSTLISCDSLGPLEARQLHGIIIKNGLFHSDAFSATSILCLFGRCEMLAEAFQIFEEIPSKNLVTWNSIISLAARHGLTGECFPFFRHLLRTRLGFSESSVVAVLTGLSSQAELFSGEQVHSLVTKCGLESDVLVSNSLIHMYADCSRVEAAHTMFENAAVWDIVSWNTIITALAKSHLAAIGFNLFLEIRRWAKPNLSTYVGAITCCSAISAKWCGNFVHGGAIKVGFTSDPFVGTSLLGFYAKSDRHDIRESRLCFEDIENKNMGAWNALILGYSSSAKTQCGGWHTPFLVLKQMLWLGVKPNEVSFSTLIMSAGAKELRQLHSLVIRSGFNHNEYLLSSLITSCARNKLLRDAFAFVLDLSSPVPAIVACNTMAGVYNREGKYEETRRLMSSLGDPDNLSWNMLLEACTNDGDYATAFGYFKGMLMWGRRGHYLPDGYTFVSLVRGCTKMCNLVLGVSVHCQMTKAVWVGGDTVLSNMMVEMYGKCGSIQGAEKVFNEIIEKNVMSWTVMISSLGMHGRGVEAVRRLGEMEAQGVVPESETFTAVFMACRHGGMVKEGMGVFHEMRGRYGVEAKQEQYECMVDLLARNGHLKEAERFILDMHLPPTPAIWRSFLHACDTAISVACA